MCDGKIKDQVEHTKYLRFIDGSKTWLETTHKQSASQTKNELKTVLFLNF